MVFKPFKPLSIRKPTDSASSNETSSLRDNAPADDHGPPAKKPRLQQPTPAAPNGERKPLLQVKNHGGLLNDDNDKTVNNPGPGEERYYNALWYENLSGSYYCTMALDINQRKPSTGANSPPKRTKPGTGMVF